MSNNPNLEIQDVELLFLKHVYLLIYFTFHNNVHTLVSDQQRILTLENGADETATYGNEITN
jgi:hypothetical protein